MDEGPHAWRPGDEPNSGQVIPGQMISLRKGAPAAGGYDDVGEFRQGSPLSQWALSRYLVGRAIAESVSTSLLIAGLVMLVVAGLIWWAGSSFWAVLVAIVGSAVLAMRALLLAVLRRLTAAREYGPIETRLRDLVADTRSDVLRELRRIGLPGRTWSLPLLAMRFLGRERRQSTVTRLRTFELERAVPRARLDELHLLLRSALGRTAPPH